MLSSIVLGDVKKAKAAFQNDPSTNPPIMRANRQSRPMSEIKNLSIRSPNDVKWIFMFPWAIVHSTRSKLSDFHIPRRLGVKLLCIEPTEVQIVNVARSNQKYQCKYAQYTESPSSMQTPRVNQISFESNSWVR